MSVTLLGWGLKGVEALREACATLVIVDVLSFSTAVDVAVSRQAAVYPFALGDPLEAEAEALRLGATAARPRKAAGGQISLSPPSLMRLEPGDNLLLPSPNGARLTLECGKAQVYCACLRNVTAVASALRMRASGPIGVIAAGERWPDGSLRPAIEDELGAGALLDALGGALSAEAEVARSAFLGLRPRLDAIIATSQSGRELTDRGYGQDVAMALEMDVSDAIPLLVDGAFRGQ